MDAECYETVITVKGNPAQHVGTKTFLRALIGLGLLVASCAAPAITTPSPTASPPVATNTPAAGTPAQTIVVPAATTAPVAPRGSAEELADRLGDALEASDWPRIQTLMAPAGWNAGWWRSEGTPNMTPSQAVDWLKARTRDGRLSVTVQRRPVLASSTLGENPSRPYVISEWRDFDSGIGGRLPTQRVVLLFNQDATGVWYWKTAIFNYTT